MWEMISNNVIRWMTNVSMWENIAIIALKILLIVVLSQILLKILKKFIVRAIVEKESQPLHINVRRTKTMGKLANNIITYAVNFVMILMVLNQFGIKIGPILAGAGVVGIAIGFGAQSLVRDILTGFFIIFEDQFGVGDVIQTGTFKGTVEEIGLRVTTIKSPTGEVHIIPNGAIVNVTNFSMHNTVSTIDIPLDSNVDPDVAIEVVRHALKDAHVKVEQLVKEPEVLGIQSIVPGEMILRVSVETVANGQFAVLRQLNVDIKKSLDANQIQLASGAKR